jgi:hypothetical protein
VSFQGLTLRRELLLVGAITAVAAALRLYRIDSVSLIGDEFGSVREAGQLGLNLNSIPYFLILRAWTHFGSSDLMLRLPSMVLGTLVVPVSYLLGKELLGSWAHGALTALLNATSAYAIEYSQQVRFYSLFLLASCLAFLAFARYLRARESRGRLWILIGADLLCMVSHALGFVVVIVQIVCVLGGKVRRGLGLVLACLCGFGLLVLLFLQPGWLALPFGWLMRYQGTLSATPYAGPRGLQASTLAKIPVAFFFYLFGTSVYPLTLWLVVPGLAVVGFLTLRGLLAIRRREGVLRLVAGWIIVPMLVLFLVFDAVVPQSFVGADARYAIYVLVALQLIISGGILSLGRSRAVIGALCFLVIIVSLGAYYYPIWSHTSRLGNWRNAASYVNSRVRTNTLILHDGRSGDGVTRYFPVAPRRELFWNYLKINSSEALQQFEQVIVVSNDFKAENRQDLNRFVRSLQGRFYAQDSYVQYPLFVLAMQRGTADLVRPADSTGQVPIPTEVYGMEFADLELPRTAHFAGRALHIVGGFSLPGPDGERERVIEAAGQRRAKSLIVLSNLVGAGGVAQRAPVAELTVQSRNQGTCRFTLRRGVETNDWSQGRRGASRASDGCFVADSWKKRVALVGRRAYEGAWREFDAHIFGAKLDLPTSMAADRIQIRYLLERGYLQIWGMEMAD